MENKKLSICDCVSQVFKSLKKTEFNIEKFDDVSKQALVKLTDFYKLSEKETILLVLALEALYTGYEDEGVIDFSDIRRSVDCDAMKIIPYNNQINSLIDKHYLLRHYSLSDNNCFSINEQVLDALAKESFDGISEKEDDINDKYAFIRSFAEIYERGSSRSLRNKKILLSRMEQDHMNNEFVGKMVNLISETEERFMFYDCCGDFLEGHTSNLMGTLHDIYSEKTAKEKTKLMADGKGFLLENNFLQLIKKDSISETMIEPTDKAKELLLGDDLCLYEKKFSADDMIEYEKISTVKLFYSSENQKQIDTLADYLSPEHFALIRNSLKEKGMRTGFTVLLHGDPGTGKTETVYQLAKRTCRGIVKVDVAKSKSCWFGESEKLIKEIFDKYHSVCKRAEQAKENIPILLFNEADAIFSKRKDVASGSVAQTENAIQNIILDEMENLDGILIATTNLTDNFDKAFERRFLYKICFDNPTFEARLSIWKSRLSALPQDSLNHLAEYELSGGQIENIVRKVTMNEILTGNLPDFNELDELCSEERISKSDKPVKIGFVA